jgi:hypothetical protein
LFVGNVLKRDVLSIIFCTMPVVMSWTSWVHMTCIRYYLWFDRLCILS